jgi:hypothetical protein
MGALPRPRRRSRRTFPSSSQPHFLVAALPRRRTASSSQPHCLVLVGALPRPRRRTASSSQPFGSVRDMAPRPSRRGTKPPYTATNNTCQDAWPIIGRCARKVSSECTPVGHATLTHDTVLHHRSGHRSNIDRAVARGRLRVAKTFDRPSQGLVRVLDTLEQVRPVRLRLRLSSIQTGSEPVVDGLHVHRSRVE